MLHNSIFSFINSESFLNGFSFLFSRIFKRNSSTSLPPKLIIDYACEIWYPSYTGTICEISYPTSTTIPVVLPDVERTLEVSNIIWVVLSREHFEICGGSAIKTVYSLYSDFSQISLFFNLIPSLLLISNYQNKHYWKYNHF